MSILLVDLLSLFAALGEVLLEFWFLAALCSRRLLWDALPFLSAACLAACLPLPAPVKLLLSAGAMLLYGALRAGPKRGLFCTLLTLSILQLCFGAVGSALTVLSAACPARDSILFGWLFLTTGSLLSLLAAYLCFRLILHRLPREGLPYRSMLLMLTPLLLIFAVSSSILHSFYGNAVSSEHMRFLPNFQMLLIQSLGICSVFCILHVCRKLAAQFALQEKLTAAAQQNRLQKQYILEAQERSAASASLRHDLRNHALVLRGLLKNKDYEKASDYLGQLEATAETLSFPFHTGNPVLDILLENKAALAACRGIPFSGSVTIPPGCCTSDTDLCIILANALDNAIHACEQPGVPAPRFIRVSSRLQGDFLLLEVENSSAAAEFRPGTGLANIQWAAERYGGCMELSASGKTVCLRVLLDISQPPEDIPHQSY